MGVGFGCDSKNSRDCFFSVSGGCITAPDTGARRGHIGGLGRTLPALLQLDSAITKISNSAVVISLRISFVLLVLVLDTCQRVRGELFLGACVGFGLSQGVRIVRMDLGNLGLVAKRCRVVAHIEAAARKADQQQ